MLNPMEKCIDNLLIDKAEDRILALFIGKRLSTVRYLEDHEYTVTPFDICKNEKDNDLNDWQDDFTVISLLGVIPYLTKKISLQKLIAALVKRLSSGGIVLLSDSDAEFIKKTKCKLPKGMLIEKYDLADIGITLLRKDAKIEVKIEEEETYHTKRDAFDEDTEDDETIVVGEVTTKGNVKTTSEFDEANRLINREEAINNYYEKNCGRNKYTKALMQFPERGSSFFNRHLM